MTPRLPLLPDPAAASRVSRHRRRVNWLLGAMLLLPVVLVLAPFGMRRFGEPMAAGESVSVPGAAFIRGDKPTVCALTRPGVEPERVLVPTDSGIISIGGLAVQGPTEVECEADVMVATGSGAAVQRTGKGLWVLLALWPLLALATMVDALWLLRRRLKWGA